MVQEMATTTTVRHEAVSLRCVCGAEMLLDPELVGRIITCRACGRYLRVSLRFLLMAQGSAPNLTVQCTCGHFLVEPASSVGKRCQCKVCKRYLMMPQPVFKPDAQGPMRITRNVLKKRLRQTGPPMRSAPRQLTRLESAAHSGRIRLRPGEHICVNRECGALMPAGANVCSKCGTNRLTGQAYEGPGPAGDPRPKWQRV